MVSHPTVETAPVEYVAAIREPSDLVLSLELVEAHRAPLRRFLHRRQLGEFRHRKDFPDEQGAGRFEFGHYPIGPGNVGFETQVAEDDGHELPDETQHGKEMHEQLWQHKLRIPHWKSHPLTPLLCFDCLLIYILLLFSSLLYEDEIRGFIS